MITQEEFILALFDKDELRNHLLRMLDKDRPGAFFCPNVVDIAAAKKPKACGKSSVYDWSGKTDWYGGNAAERHIMVRRTFFLEFDDGAVGEQNEKIDYLFQSLRPTAKVFSGSKSIHVFFRVLNGYSEYAWKVRQLFLINYVNSNPGPSCDSKVQSSQHRMRLGGYKCKERDQKVLSLGDRIPYWDFEAWLHEHGFEDFVKEYSQKQQKKSLEVQIQKDKLKGGHGIPRNIVYGVAGDMILGVERMSSGGRNIMMFAASCTFFELRILDLISDEELNSFMNYIYKTALSKGLAAAEIQRTIESAKQEASSGEFKVLEKISDFEHKQKTWGK